LSRFEIQSPSEPSRLAIETRWLLAQMAWFLAENLLRIEPLSAESIENLKKADELLTTHSAVFYMNHVRKADISAVAMVLKYLRRTKNGIIPAGLTHFDVERDKVSGYFYRAVRPLHVSFLPVLQDSDTQKNIYTPDEIAMISNQLRVLSQEAITSPGNIIAYTPEGTRHSDNILRQAKTGIGRNEQYHGPFDTFYLPVTQLYPPYSKRIRTTVGAPFFLPDILDLDALPVGVTLEKAKKRARIITDALMYALAEQLPEENRGYYHTTTE